MTPRGQFKHYFQGNITSNQVPIQVSEETFFPAFSVAFRDPGIFVVFFATIPLIPIPPTS
jgi:hypothetical protein